MIINLLPKSNEMIEQSIMFNESMRGFGYRCTIIIPESVDIPDMGYHPDIGYKEEDKKVVYISIDPHPKPKLLYSLGWNIESDDTKPMICYVSRYIQSENHPRDVLSNEYIELLPTRYTRLILEYDYQDLGKEFIVTKVSSHQFNPIYYILMIVPYRPTIPDDAKDPYQEDNLSKLHVQESVEDFQFLDKDRFTEVGIKY